MAKPAPFQIEDRFARPCYADSDEAHVAAIAEMGIVLNGQWLPMRRHSMQQWLEWRPSVAAWIADVVPIVNEVLYRGRVLRIGEMYELACRHIDAVLPLVLAAAGVDRNFVEPLDQVEGEVLITAWWAVNGGHFAGFEIWLMRQQAQQVNNPRGLMH